MTIKEAKQLKVGDVVRYGSTECKVDGVNDNNIAIAIPMLWAEVLFICSYWLGPDFWKRIKKVKAPPPTKPQRKKGKR